MRAQPALVQERPEASVDQQPGTGPVWCWAVTLFASAMLLFWVQPMVARLLLPQLGGSPAVWNTCMVFFQTLLLAGYLYSHFLVRQLRVRTQWVVHGTLLLAAFLSLPITLPKSIQAPWQGNPTLWLLKNLLLMTGLPFFVLSSTAPLLQTWFSRTNRDPYFLYSASNLGSFAALIGYPLLIEPALRLKEQSFLWAVGYAGLVILIGGCAFISRRQPAREVAANITVLPVPISRRLRWALLAFVTSSLMLGVTTYLTTDIASIPLLWVVPLALYLLTFAIAFSRVQLCPLDILVKALPIAAVALIFLILTGTRNPAWLIVLLHVLFFFIAALICHTKLSRDRPNSEHLTGFYVWLSIGGAAGGFFNALLAPTIFRTVAEYPLALVLACLVCGSDIRSKASDWLLPAGLAIVTGTLAKLAHEQSQSTALVVFGVPLIICYFFSKSPLRFALGLGAVILGAHFYTAVHGKTLCVDRNFFGAIRVTLDPNGELRRFYHGTTVHGCQYIASERRQEPLAYYHRTGPFGAAYAAFTSRRSDSPVASIGLGAGAVASYAQPGQPWTFYEIDPAVLRIARDTNYFTYLAESRAALDYKLGDARLRLREAPDGHYGLIICDAFSSDVPPLHLMTLEAMDLYLSKLAPDGMLLFHVSSRYLDFGPVLGSLAKARALCALEFNESAVSADDMKAGKYPSRWIVIARDRGHVGKLGTDPRWQPVEASSRMRVWTDDYSNLFSIFDWQ